MRRAALIAGGALAALVAWRRVHLRRLEAFATMLREAHEQGPAGYRLRAALAAGAVTDGEWQRWFGLQSEER
jgi:hypothetical protein